MKRLIKNFIPIVLFVSLFSFNAFAMENNLNNPPRETPLSNAQASSLPKEIKWTWLNDDTCVQFRATDDMKRSRIEDMFNWGMIKRWAECGNDGRSIMKIREIYAGTWSTSSDGVKSFVFDDCTIPVGAIKIDGVLYAFNSYGELKEGYEYYTGFKTGADGLVIADTEEFKQWLGMQYLPECTSHEKKEAVISSQDEAIK